MCVFLVLQYLWLRFKVRGMVLFGTFLQVLAICVINGVVLFGPALMLESSKYGVTLCYGCDTHWGIA